MDGAGADQQEYLGDARLTAMGLLMETHAGMTSVFATELEELGVSGSAFEVMIRLAHAPDQRLRMAELAAQSILSSSGLTRLIDRLESGGLVARVPCETDRRGSYAVLTPEGRAKVLGVLPAHLDTVERIFTGVLEPDELRGFLQVLRKLRRVVKPGADPHVARRLAERRT